MKKFIIFIALVVFLSACGDFSIQSPVGPSNLRDDNFSQVTAKWDPYIGVHPFNPQIQKPHLEKLIQAGQLQGIRMDVSSFGFQDLSSWFLSRGVEVLGIFSNEYLRSPNVCQIFSNTVMQNRNIKYWEIGNEVTHFAGIGPEEYMKIFKKVFYYAKSQHPNIVVINQAPVGNGQGADRLRRMIDAGLDDLCNNGLQVVSIHFYSHATTRIHEFKKQITRLPITTQIWITETNHMPANWLRHIEYVEKIYPRLRNSLRASRIYWYVFAEHGEFSLVKGLSHGAPAEYSPLMIKLAGENIGIE